jgi:two-component system, NarL family, sensor kinase
MHPTDEKDIVTGIIGGSVLILLLGVFILLFLLYFQRRHNAHLRDKAAMRRSFEDNLAQTKLEVQEQTRQHLAAELHDNIGQILSMTSMTLTSVNLEDGLKAAEKIVDAQRLVARSIQEMRHLSKVLQGQEIIREGLLEAIRRDLEWLENKGFYMIRLDIQSNGQEFGKEDLNLFIYRIFQESLNNILKHAQADAISIFLSYLHPSLYLTISDNGKGFDKEAVFADKKGLGLGTMKRRVELLGGTMELNTEVGKGSILMFKIPYYSFESAI